MLSPLATARAVTTQATRRSDLARVRQGPRLAIDRGEVIGVVAGLALILMLAPFAGWPWTPGADWLWYRTGVDNLVGGRPLYDPRLLVGPYEFLDQANVFAYNMPPWVVPLIAPFAALGDAGRWAWLVAMDAATAAAIMLALPGRHRILATGLLLASTPVLMLLVWGNIGSIALLGVAIWFVGWRRGSDVLMGAGLLLASVKVLPAIPLALVMLREGRWRPVAAAAALTIGVTAALSAATGRNVLADFALTIGNIRQVGALNLAPSSYVGHATEIRIAAIVAIGLLALLRPRPWTIAAMLLATCGLITNLYSDWLLLPVLVLMGSVTSRSTATRDASEADAVAARIGVPARGARS